MESKISRMNWTKLTKKSEGLVRRTRWVRQFTWTWRLFKAAWTALNVLSAKDGETLREWGRDGWVGRWGETERGERSLKTQHTFFSNISGYNWTQVECRVFGHTSPDNRMPSTLTRGDIMEEKQYTFNFSKIESFCCRRMHMRESTVFF